MNGAAEREFAWALLDLAGSFLPESTHGWICRKIRAGEQGSAIRDLLTGLVDSDTALPATLVAALWAWIGGFAGSSAESGLRELAIRIRVTTSSYRVVTIERSVVSLIAQRGDTSTRRVGLSLATGR